MTERTPEAVARNKECAVIRSTVVRALIARHEQEFYDLLNAERRGAGLSPVQRRDRKGADA